MIAANTATMSQGRVKVGCCGFPVRMAEYFAQFKLVEVQSTFYSGPGWIPPSVGARKPRPTLSSA